MDYERGLSRLREQLGKMNDEETSRHLTKLEAALDAFLKLRNTSIHSTEPPQELREILNGLDKIAYRTSGRPFANLCDWPRTAHLANRLSFPLSGVLLLVAVLVSLPLVSTTLAASVLNADNQQHVNQLRRQVQDIDEQIGKDVLSSLYLSRQSPCDDSALEAITAALIRIDVGSDCTWGYRDATTGQLIAKDQWQIAYPILQSRDYYINGALVARDFFNSGFIDCFKHRVFFDNQGRILAEDCFSEAGVMRAQAAPGGATSPIPPMLYWFFYR